MVRSDQRFRAAGGSVLEVAWRGGSFCRTRGLDGPSNEAPSIFEDGMEL